MSTTFWGYPVSVIDTDKVAVILLSQPGPARDKLRAAISNAGGHVALESSPGEASAEALLARLPAAVVLALDDSDDLLLETLLTPLSDAGVLLVLEEAGVAATREGWDAQRWERHLAAKLQGHRNVLPPGGEEEPLSWPPLSVAPPSLTDATLSPLWEDNALDLSPVAAPGLSLSGEMRLESEHRLAFAEPTFPGFSLTDGQRTPVVDLAPEDSAAWQSLAEGDDSLDWEPPVSEVDAPVNGLEFIPALDGDLPAVHADSSVEGLSLPANLSLEALSDTSSSGFMAQESPRFPAPPPLPAAAPSRTASVPPPSQWSLMGLDEALEPAAAPEPAAVLAERNWNLGGLSLAPLDGEEIPADAVVPAFAADLPAPRGFGILLAGIGGPDAVRRLLAVLPEEGMGGAVLIQLKLDGGRHANLVTQLARACPAPLLLAQPGEVIGAGRVYVLDDQTVVRTVSGVSRFATAAAGETLLGDLPLTAAGVVMLSGADPVQVPEVIALQAKGVWVAGQSGEGCYDPAAASALAVAGLPVGEPAWLASGLMALWQ